MPGPDPLLGTTVAGRYKVIELLGEGGMGAVYLSEHVAIEKRIALKVLHPEYASKGDIVTRFHQEAVSASRIKHPNVLEIFDFGQLESGSFYLAMEFLEGNDLADEIQRHGVLDPARGLHFALQICRALAAAHAKGVVHRDMKPENVFLQRTPDGEEIIKIVDFGIAQLRTNDQAAAGATQRRLTRTGMIFGTPEYMSPEQAGGKHADLRADVYAVGIILYEMFTGAVPFTGETFLGVLAKHLNETAPALSAVYPEIGISLELQATILRTLEKDPDARYQSMGELSQALGATPEGRGLLHGGAPLTSSRTELHEHPAGTRERTRTSPDPRRHDGTHSATTTNVTPGKGRAGVLLLVTVGLLGAAGAGFLIHRGGLADVPSVTPVAAETPPTPTKPVETPIPMPPRTVTTPLPTTAIVTPATQVRLKVVTEPPGATLTKDGFQVCDKTPCEVMAAPNETLELAATKDSLSGKAKVLAQRDQRVSIKLVGAVKKAPPEPKLCELEVDGIKILRPCQ